MPIYEYYCDDCKKPFEVFVRSISAPVTPVCPACGGRHVEKEATAASAIGLSNAASSASCAPSG
ncbi:MAG: zinc ribbon domain-containing protein [Chloroflexi bacterium]|nr:zinc ribbon domain-containing protein [Chloroflexota bacterium]